MAFLGPNIPTVGILPSRSGQELYENTAMFFRVNVLRQQGIVIPRHHIVRSHNEVVGRFSLAEKYDGEICRHVRLARLLPLMGGAEDVLPPLIDATVIYASDNVWTVTGFARDAKSGGVSESAYLQSWLMNELTLAEMVEIAHERQLPRADNLTA